MSPRHPLKPLFLMMIILTILMMDLCLDMTQLLVWI